MDLIGQLSNPPALLKRVLDVPVPQGRVEQVAALRAGPRRRLGDIRHAIVAVLAEEGGPLRVAEIYERVVARLDEPPPSYLHVKDSLSHRSRGSEPLYERLGYGLYQLDSRRR
jgi:hypothetical protein